MGRHIGNKNIKSNIRSSTSNLSTEERIHLIANIIIDKIVEDQKNGGTLFKKLML
jgi:uncharacterized membrane-anchored protein